MFNETASSFNEWNVEVIAIRSVLAKATGKVRVEMAWHLNVFRVTRALFGATSSEDVQTYSRKLFLLSHMAYATADLSLTI